jgi:hypothetical protein
LKRNAVFKIALSLALVGTGCTNNFLRSVTTGSGKNITTGNTPSSFNNASGGLLTVVRAQKSSFSSATDLDLVGDGTGGMGQFCTSKDAKGGSTGASTCTCAFTFTSGGNTQSFEVDTTYHESNLIRCSYINLPGDAASITVAVHLTNVDAFSNAVKFALGAGASFNPSDITSFAPVKRVQCRDIVTIPYLFDAALFFCSRKSLGCRR